MGSPPGSRRVTLVILMDEPADNKPWDEADFRTWLDQHLDKEAWDDIVQIEDVHIESDMTDQDVR